MEPIDRVQKLTDIKQKILNLIKIRGPVLPVHAAKETGTSMLLSSAFLSQLVSEKSLKISNLKVGGSPLYFLEGQESYLEKFYNYLPGKEKEAYFMLKENKILQDDKLEPSIRVALRNIKDFAFPIKLDANEAIFWRFYAINEEEAGKIIEEKTKSRGIEKLAAIKLSEEKLEEKKLIQPIIQPAIQETKPKEIKEIKILLKPRKKKEKSVEFLEEVKEFLLKKDIEFLQEIEFDKSEVIAKARINSDLGKIILLLIAKDKKRITEADLIKAYQKATNEKMPCYLLFRGELSKKMQEYAESYKNLLKIEKIS